MLRCSNARLGLLVALLLISSAVRALAGHYALAYWREWGYNENSGNHSIHVFVWNESGAPVPNVQVYTSWGVLQGTTNSDGYCQIAQYVDADRDVKLQDGIGSTSDISPKFSTARYPDWGHYSHEVGFLYKSSAGNPGTFDMTAPCGPANERGGTANDAPHTASLIYNAINCQDRNSDAFTLDSWSGSFSQTFVVPAGTDRIAGVQFHGTIGGNTPFTWSVSVHEGGPTGPTIFSKTLPHDFYPFRTFLSFGVNSCPVTPGQTYAVKFSRPGGMNAYTVANVYPNGQFYRDTTAVGTRDLEAFVLGMSYGGGVTPTVTPTPTHTLTRTPTRTPTLALPDLDGDGVPDVFEGNPPTANQSHRLLPDSDADGLRDGTEDRNANGIRDAGETGTRLRDSDGDQVWDGVEVLLLSTDPLNPAQPSSVTDLDGDGLPAPYDFFDTLPDADGDRYSDGYEAVAVNPSAWYDIRLMPTLGDVNKDQTITNVDALVVQSLFLGMIDASAPVFQGNGFTNADASVDGYITNVDGLILQSYFLSLLSTIPLPGPPITPGPATATPTATSPGAATATPTPTASPTRTATPGAVILSVPFETFNVVNWGIGHDLWLPYFDPAISNSWMWPKHDGGSWAQLYWERGTQSRSGYSFELRVQGTPEIRGNGAEWWFRGATALPTNRDLVVEVWTTCTRISANEYTDIVVAWSPGNDNVELIQDYDRVSRRANVGGWALHTLAFRSHSNPAEGDRIGLLFATASTVQPFVSAFFDDLVIRSAN